MTRVRRKCTKRHLVYRRGDERSVRIAVDRAMIDAEDTCLAVEEGVWTWIGGTFYDVFSEYDIRPF